MSTAQCLRLHRPRIFHPAKMIDVMDVKIAVAAAASPKETMKLTNLPKQLARVARPFCRESVSHRPVHAITAHQDEISDLAVLDAFMQFLQRAAMTRHQS